MAGSAYFIYYRVPSAAAQRVVPLVSAMQARLRADTGITGRLLRRADDATWMEIYDDVVDAPAFESTLARLVREFGLDRLLAAGEVRNLERFLPCV